MKLNLIVPIAGDKEDYNHRMPSVFSLNQSGYSLCVQAILGLDLERFDNIFFIILRKHDIKYHLAKLLNIQIERLNLDNARIIILDEPTRNQPETVYKAILQENINGAIYIKDSDSYYEQANIEADNSVTVYPLDQLDIISPKNKSYVEIDDQFFITNIIEKKIISRYFSAGGYIFSSHSLFCTYYEKLKRYPKVYISHLIYKMLLDGISFRPQQIKDYIDWGNTKSVARYLNFKSNNPW